MWPRLELECFCFFLFRTTFFNGRTRVRECCTCRWKLLVFLFTEETGKGTLDLAGGVRFFEELLLASLDASMSATYFCDSSALTLARITQGVCFRQFILKICRKFLRLSLMACNPLYDDSSKLCFMDQIRFSLVCNGTLCRAS